MLKAAELNDGSACQNVALFYEKGWGTKVNMEKALYY